MFFIFSPYSFMYLLTYIMFLFSLFQLSSFYYYWAVIEIMMLIFMGISYSIILSSYCQLIMYFLVQALASFLLLIFYICSADLLLTVAFLLKLSMFPFFMWYINVVYSLPNFVFWLVGTLHNLPPLLIIKVFVLPINLPLLWSSMLATTLIIGLIMLSLVDLRILLVLSSIGNNSWLLLSQFVSLYAFLFYLLVYSISLFFVLYGFGSLSKLSSLLSISSSPNSLSFWVLTVSGLPPFPLFFCKMVVLLSLFYSLSVNFVVLVFLLSSAFIFISYLQSLINYYVNMYSYSLLYFVKF